MLHNDIDENKMPVDMTNEFSTNVQRIYCTALVHSAKGRMLRVRCYLGNQVESFEDVAIEDDRELKATVYLAPDPGRTLRPGRGFFEWCLDDQVMWRVPFRIVQSAS